MMLPPKVIRPTMAPRFPAHKAWYEGFHHRGDLLVLGVFDDPQRNGSMAVFRARQAAEEFAAGDPFVRHGVIRSWQIREGNGTLSPA